MFQCLYNLIALARLITLTTYHRLLLAKLVCTSCYITDLFILNLKLKAPEQHH